MKRCYVPSLRCRGLTTAVAQQRLDEYGPNTILEKRQRSLLKILLGRYLALAVLAICAVVFTAGLLQGQPMLLMFLTAVSLAVAAIPEALPAVITISLALGPRLHSGMFTILKH